MIKEEFLEKHWRFYRMLEKRFINTLQYIELDKQNFDTFSMEFVSQIREIGSEIDIVLKELLGYGQEKRTTIAHYIKGLEQQYPEIFNRKLLVRGIEIIPFENLDKKNPSKLFWWEVYNDIKHGRTLNYKKANMKNTLVMLATLYLLEMYLLKKSIQEDESDIVNDDIAFFRIVDWTTSYASMQGLCIKKN